MKMMNKFLMSALVLSVFFGCKKDEEDKNLPLTGIVGTYEGTITIPHVDTIVNVPITIAIPTDNSGNTISLTIPKDIFPVISVQITAPCTVTSDSEKYSFTGSTSVPMQPPVEIPVTIEDGSNITKAGVAYIKIKVEVPAGVPQAGTLNVTFDGQKK
jgi:hypothetical protein